MHFAKTGMTDTKYRTECAAIRFSQGFTAARAGGAHLENRGSQAVDRRQGLTTHSSAVWLRLLQTVGISANVCHLYYKHVD